MGVGKTVFFGAGAGAILGISSGNIFTYTLAGAMIGGVTGASGKMVGGMFGVGQSQNTDDEAKENPDIESEDENIDTNTEDSDENTQLADEDFLEDSNKSKEDPFLALIDKTEQEHKERMQQAEEHLSHNVPYDLNQPFFNRKTVESKALELQALGERLKAGSQRLDEQVGVGPYKRPITIQEQRLAQEEEQRNKAREEFIESGKLPKPRLDMKTQMQLVSDRMNSGEPEMRNFSSAISSFAQYDRTDGSVARGAKEIYKGLVTIAATYKAFGAGIGIGSVSPRTKAFLHQSQQESSEKLHNDISRVSQGEKKQIQKLEKEAGNINGFWNGVGHGIKEGAFYLSHPNLIRTKGFVSFAGDPVNVVSLGVAGTISKLGVKASVKASAAVAETVGISALFSGKTNTGLTGIENPSAYGRGAGVGLLFSPISAGVAVKKKANISSGDKYQMTAKEIMQDSGLVGRSDKHSSINSQNHSTPSVSQYTFKAPWNNQRGAAKIPFGKTAENLASKKMTVSDMKKEIRDREKAINDKSVVGTKRNKPFGWTADPNQYVHFSEPELFRTLDIMKQEDPISRFQELAQEAIVSGSNTQFKRWVQERKTVMEMLRQQGQGVSNYFGKEDWNNIVQWAGDREGQYIHTNLLVPIGDQYLSASKDFPTFRIASLSELKKTKDHVESFSGKEFNVIYPRDRNDLGYIEFPNDSLSSHFSYNIAPYSTKSTVRHEEYGHFYNYTGGLSSKDYNGLTTQEKWELTHNYKLAHKGTPWEEYSAIKAQMKYLDIDGAIPEMKFISGYLRDQKSDAKKMFESGDMRNNLQKWIDQDPVTRYEFDVMSKDRLNDKEFDALKQKLDDDYDQNKLKFQRQQIKYKHENITGESQHTFNAPWNKQRGAAKIPGGEMVENIASKKLTFSEIKSSLSSTLEKHNINLTTDLSNHLLPKIAKETGKDPALFSNYMDKLTLQISEGKQIVKKHEEIASWSKEESAKPYNTNQPYNSRLPVDDRLLTDQETTLLVKDHTDGVYNYNDYGHPTTDKQKQDLARIDKALVTYANQNDKFVKPENGSTTYRWLDLDASGLSNFVEGRVHQDYIPLSTSVKPTKFDGLSWDNRFGEGRTNTLVLIEDPDGTGINTTAMSKFGEDEVTFRPDQPMLVTSVNPMDANMNTASDKMNPNVNIITMRALPKENKDGSPIVRDVYTNENGVTIKYSDKQTAIPWDSIKKDDE